MTAEDLRAHLARFRFSYANEDDLQRGVTEALASVGIEITREVRLGDAGRIDGLVDRVGIEVKVIGSAPRVYAQLERYAAREELDELLLVTTRAKHRPPPVMCGKPVAVHLVVA